MRRTKIVATLGPRTSEPATIRALLEAGADVVRLNAAHGDAPTHERNARLAREAAAELGRTVGVLVDLPGPKMRTGPVKDDAAYLVPGDPFVLRGQPVIGDATGVSTTVDGLAGMVHAGDDIFLADGEVVLRVVRVGRDDVNTEVVRGGTIRSRKGLFVPAAEAHVERFTDADAAALEMAMGLRADFIGVSFVARASDCSDIRALFPRRGPRPHVVAKIETRSALDDLDAIVRATDVVMVARGDLGVQLDVSQVPLLQKQIIRTANEAGCPVVTATQMLESMTRSPLPTRAEASDVANAVIDGSDALMLSEETAVGAHPVLTVATMARLAVAAETWPAPTVRPHVDLARDDPVAWAIAHAAVEAAQDLGVAAILCPTRTGTTAQHVAAFRPRVPVAGLSTRDDVLAGLSIVWGVRPLRWEEPEHPSDTPSAAAAAAQAAGIVEHGQLVAVVSGSAGRRAGSTDMVRIVRT